ncbi:MAG: DUF4870 domain-containing protein [Candidatus Eremiobacteraeota bacterium]|nr:DUF4870 domain-containing protein [Candidatus Eremiobacteraeota bacterium]MBV8499463.1 DUF4870 domain-containing protein [Candidatus Eremiobacteraeota bacterium]
MAAHLSALVAVAGLPFGHVLGPLIVYLIKGHESEFVGEHAKASLNYQITISILCIVAILVGVALSLGYLVNSTSDNSNAPAIGFGVMWIAIAIAAVVLLLFSLIFIIMGTIAANEGRPYTYPFAIRFLR